MRRTVLSEALHTAAAAAVCAWCATMWGGPPRRTLGLVRRSASALPGGRGRSAFPDPPRPSASTGRTAAGGGGGIRRHYQVSPWSDTVEVHWAGGTEAYVTPVADDTVGVAILTSGAGPVRRSPQRISGTRGTVGGRPARF